MAQGEQMDSQRFTTKLGAKWIFAISALFGVSLLSAGVFAASQITLNSGNAVNLGAGTAPVDACQTQATISTQQTFSESSQVFNLSTVSVTLNTDNCRGKELALAFKAGPEVIRTTWAIDNAGGVQTFSRGGFTIPTAQANISTIAISVQ